MPEFDPTQKIEGVLNDQEMLDLRAGDKLKKSMEKVIEHFKGKKDIVGVEVGVFKGVNAYNVLSNFEGLDRLHLIDPYLPLLEKKPLPFPMIILYHAIEKLLPFKDKVQWWFISSQEAAHGFMPHSIDFVHLDGAVSEKEWKTDFITWWYKVKPGGMVTGDGYWKVGIYLYEMCVKNNLIFNYDENNLDWWIYKTRD